MIMMMKMTSTLKRGRHGGGGERGEENNGGGRRGPTYAEIAAAEHAARVQSIPTFVVISDLCTAARPTKGIHCVATRIYLWRKISGGVRCVKKGAIISEEGDTNREKELETLYRAARHTNKTQYPIPVNSTNHFNETK